MYIVFYGVGNYKIFSDYDIAKNFAKSVGITWIAC